MEEGTIVRGGRNGKKTEAWAKQNGPRQTFHWLEMILLR
ncbi:hypothetical protein SAMN04488602_101678 [Paenibacillus sp. cl123]|nr:hypothetical protein SAMN04488602_101678 [Paenibacillus sp. cl123]